MNWIRKYTVSGVLLLDILFLYSIILDCINGILSVQYSIELPIGKLFRTVLLGILLFQIVFNVKKSEVVPSSIGWIPIVVSSLYLVSFIYWETKFPLFDLGQEFGVWVSYVYRLITVLYFYKNRYRFRAEQILRIIYVTFVALGLLNILLYITGWGLSTYFVTQTGVKAFYQDGNAFSMYMLMLYPCAIVYWIQYGRTRTRLMGLLGGFLGTFLIGTRAAVVGSVSVTIVTLLIGLVGLFNDYKLALFHRICLFGGIIVCLGVGWTLLPERFVLKGRYLEHADRFTVKAMGSSRMVLIKAGQRYIESYAGTEWLLGQGSSAATRGLAKQMNISLEAKGIESDFWDSILSYGWGLGLLLYATSVLYFAIFLKKFLKYRKSVVAAMIFIGGCLWAGLSFFSGHALYTNTLITPVLGVYVCLVYSMSNRIDEKNTLRE